jgi:lipoprotein-anchoring transpeptidase ErfK/SrfK
MRHPETHARAATLAALIVIAAVGVLAQEQPKRVDARVRAHAPAPGRRIVISIPDRKLALLEGGQVVRIYRTAVGAAASPSGTYTIVNRIPRPTYYAPRMVVEPGKANPLGTRWLGLSLKGIGIHGTNSARTIGRAASHGCIRMRNRDIEELFERVRIGDVVELVAKHDDQLAQIFGVADGRDLGGAQPGSSVSNSTGGGLQ